jgi:hypothetical protein
MLIIVIWDSRSLMGSCTCTNSPGSYFRSNLTILGGGHSWVLMLVDQVSKLTHMETFSYHFSFQMVCELLNLWRNTGQVWGVSFSYILKFKVNLHWLLCEPFRKISAKLRNDMAWRACVLWLKNSKLKYGSSPRSGIQFWRITSEGGHCRNRCLVDWERNPHVHAGSGTLAKLWAYKWLLKIKSHLPVVLFKIISSSRLSCRLDVLNGFF